MSLKLIKLNVTHSLLANPKSNQTKQKKTMEKVKEKKKSFIVMQCECKTYTSQDCIFILQNQLKFHRKFSECLSPSYAVFFFVFFCCIISHELYPRIVDCVWCAWAHFFLSTLNCREWRDVNACDKLLSFSRHNWRLQFVALFSFKRDEFSIRDTKQSATKTDNCDDINGGVWTRCSTHGEKKKTQHKNIGGETFYMSSTQW